MAVRKRARSNQKKQEAYFQDHYLLSKQFCDALWALMRERKLKSFQSTALLQAIVSQIIQHRHSDEIGLVPIPWTAFHKYARGANRHSLKGVLKTPGVYHEGYCLRWEPEDEYQELVDSFLMRPERDFYEYYALAPKANLITGRKSNRVPRSRLRDDNDNLLDQLWVDVIRIMGGVRVMFHFDDVVAHLQHRYGIMQARFEQYGKDHKKTKIAEARFRNDQYCFLAVLSQDARPLEGGYWTYQPAYSQASTGRMVHVMGGFQSCTRRMKKMAFGKIEGLKNYDLVSSHINCAIVELRLAGLSTRWLEAYRDNPDAKTVFAAAARLPVKIWKKVLLALLMGGYMPRRADEKYDDKGEIEARGEVFKLLKKVAEKEARDLQEVIDTTMLVLGELVGDLAKWHDYLLSDYVPATKRRGHNYRWYITNLVNRKLYLDELPQGKKNEWLAKSRIAAFLLQGRESAFIFNLTQLSVRFGFTVLTNEHDGLIVMGLIPEEAKKLAAQAAGLDEVRFEHKEFEDDTPDEDD